MCLQPEGLPPQPVGFFAAGSCGHGELGRSQSPVSVISLFLVNVSWTVAHPILLTSVQSKTYLTLTKNCSANARPLYCNCKPDNRLVYLN